MTINNQYITTFLSSYKIYELSKNNFDTKDLKPYIFVETKNNSLNKVVPDYIFKEIEAELFDKESLSVVILNFFDTLSKDLYIKNQKIYVKESAFEEWQNIITRVSPLTIISYFIYKQENDDLIKLFSNSLLPSIFNKRMEYLLDKYEVYDLHIHLNGTTEFDIVWQDSLKNPIPILSDYEKGFKKANVKEQYFELGIYNIVDFIDNIKSIREFRKQYQLNYTIECEMSFFINFFKILDDENSKIDDIRNFFQYILLYNTNYKLVVQQINQIGFDAFQKITDIEIREVTEKDYSKRFEQIKTLYRHNKIKLESRFAPKTDMNKFVNLLDSIKIGNKNSSLNLTSHFIKKKDNVLVENIVYRDMELRDELDHTTDNLITLLSQNEYSDIINGFDAAANELHARPEVFASIFKKIRKKGYDNFTFHGGEDFIDLVSGIRYVYEIVEFLKFDNGNRIGHATALGIEPKLWQDRVGKSLYISQGEYMDNLVFLYFISKQDRKLHHKIKLKIEDLIYKYSIEIYGEVYHISDLIEAWKLREENPKEFLYNNIKDNLKSKEIYIRYCSDNKVIKRYNKKISFNTKLLSSKELYKIQNEILKVLNSKNIIIESMITSNKMISFYKNYKEHHISRWLLKSPKPIVVIATDDPGIFATNLKNEFLHLYLILKDKLDNEEEIFLIIKELIINSNIYKFEKEVND